MRIDKYETEIIKKTIRQHIQDAKIYLFGSVIDDDKKGGDIDIFIVTQKRVDYKVKAGIKYFLEESLFKPIDLVFHKDFNKPIEKEALGGIEI